MQGPLIVQESRLQIILTAATPIIVAAAAVFQSWLMKTIAARQEHQANKVSAKVDAVADVAAITATKAQEAAAQALAVADKTHTLVNSQMGQLLLQYAVTARALADRTNKQDDIAAADLAEAKHEEHELKQSIVDRKEDAGR